MSVPVTTPVPASLMTSFEPTIWMDRMVTLVSENVPVPLIDGGFAKAAGRDVATEVRGSVIEMKKAVTKTLLEPCARPTFRLPNPITPWTQVLVLTSVNLCSRPVLWPWNRVTEGESMFFASLLQRFISDTVGDVPCQLRALVLPPAISSKEQLLSTMGLQGQQPGASPFRRLYASLGETCQRPHRDRSATRRSMKRCVALKARA